MNEQQAKKAASIVALTADTIRILMINIMAEEEVAVGELARRLGLSQSGASQQLDRFKRVGLLVQRRDKQTRYCSIEPDRIDLLQRLIAVAEKAGQPRARETGGISNKLGAKQVRAK